MWVFFNRRGAETGRTLLNHILIRSSNAFEKLILLFKNFVFFFTTFINVSQSHSFSSPSYNTHFFVHSVFQPHMIISGILILGLSSLKRISRRCLNASVFFLQMFVLMDTVAVPVGLRPYLPLLLETLLELPVKRGDVLVPYEEVVAQLETDTITTSTGIGVEAVSRFQCGAYSCTAILMLQVVMFSL
jgi:hypothetical protein